MDKKENLGQLIGDLNKILNLFKKMEKSSLDDVASLKEESNLLTKELKDRYGEKDSSETNS